LEHLNSEFKIFKKWRKIIANLDNYLNFSLKKKSLFLLQNRKFSYFFYRDFNSNFFEKNYEAI